MSPGPQISSLFALGALLLGSGAALADEGERSLSLGASYASFSVPDHTGYGAALSFDYERGVTDVLWLRASAAAAGYIDGEDLAYSGQASLGITYVLDVLRYVPYVTLGLGGVALSVDDSDAEEPIETFRPLIELGGGLDLLQSPTRSYGVYLRFESFLNRTALFQIGARYSWRSGFF